MSRRNGSSNQVKHGNPGYHCVKLTKHRNNQYARDIARGRGHEARDEMEYIRHRVRFLASLHPDARQIVAESQISTTLSMATSHLETEDFCAHVDDLSERLFQIELTIVQQVEHDAWLKDPRLNAFSRALELQERVEYFDGGTVDFGLNQAGIVVSTSGAHCRFDFGADGLNACTEFLFAYERTMRRRRVLADCVQ